MSKSNEVKQVQSQTEPSETRPAPDKKAVDRAEVEKLLRRNDEATARFSSSVSTGAATVRKK